MLRQWLDLYLLTPVEVVRAVLPEMLERGEGSVLVCHGYSVVAPSAGLSGPVPVMAAFRNYLHTLSGELAERGVYAGALAVRAVIDRGEVRQALNAGDVDRRTPSRMGAVGDSVTGGAGEVGAVAGLPVVAPGELADIMWDMTLRRDRIEVVHPAP